MITLVFLRIAVAALLIAAVWLSVKPVDLR
jgi:hypothetical protein